MSGGWDLPSSPDERIEIACYEHDVKVTQVRFLFERMKLCKNWHSEKLLKMGTKGERKVPDGYFTKEGRGIAVELELHPKKAKGYRKIFDIYKDDSKTDYIFYVCGDISLKRRMMALVEKESLLTKEYCFILFKDLMEFGEESGIQIPLKGKFKLKAVLQHVR